MPPDTRRACPPRQGRIRYTRRTRTRRWPMRIRALLPIRAAPPIRSPLNPASRPMRAPQPIRRSNSSHRSITTRSTIPRATAFHLLRAHHTHPRSSTRRHTRHKCRNCRSTHTRHLHRHPSRPNRIRQPPSRPRRIHHSIRSCSRPTLDTIWHCSPRHSRPQTSPASRRMLRNTTTRSTKPCHPLNQRGLCCHLRRTPMAPKRRRIERWPNLDEPAELRCPAQEPWLPPIGC